MAAGVLLALLASFTATSLRAQISPSDVDVEIVDAGVVVDGGAEFQLPTISRRVQTLIERRDALKGLLRGVTPDRLSIMELVGVDLGDDEAVASRAEELRDALSRRGLTDTDAGVWIPGLNADQPTDVDAGVAGSDAVEAIEAIVGAALGDGGTPDDVDGGGGIEYAEPTPENLAVVTPALEAQVDRLRLVLLEQPLEMRQRLLAAETELRSQQRLRDVAAAATARAEQDRVTAEAAMAKAKAEAEAARAGRERAIANERVRVERTRAAQASLRTELASVRADQATVIERWQALVQERQRELAEVSVGGGDTLYDGVITDLSTLRAGMRKAITATSSTLQSPRHTIPDDILRGEDDANTKDQFDALVAAVAELEVEADELDAERMFLIRQRAESAADAVRAMNKVRLDALARVSKTKRDELLGFGRAGLDQLWRELEHLGLITRFVWFVEVPALSQQVRAVSPITVTQILFHGAMLIALGVFTRIVMRRGKGWLEASKVLLARIAGSKLVTRWTSGAISALETIWESLILTVAIFIAGSVIEPARAFALVEIGYSLAMAWTVLRLVVHVVHQVIRWLARSPMGGLSPAYSEKALSSVRFVGRYIFVLYIFLHSSSAVLGEGYLYMLAVRIGVIGAIPIAVFLIRRWQDDIADTYLRMRSKGALAVAVTETRSKWFGFFIVVAAFAFVFGQAALSVARRFVLSFDQTRKALAYVFRRRLERRAREQGESESTALPKRVIEVLEVRPAEGELLCDVRILNTKDVLADVATWKKATHRVGAVVVVGRSGHGKTTWLRSVVPQIGLEQSWLTLTERVETTAALVTRLAAALGESADDMASLEAVLTTGPRRLMVIDDLQNIVLRGANHRDAWEAFCGLVERTGHHVFWLCTIGHYPWAHLQWAAPRLQVFRRIVELKPWSEPEIQLLLEKRTQVSGHEVLYDDLVIAKADEENREMQLLSTAQEYARLLWDFAEGSPSVALDAWRRSLVPTAARKLRVRLFQRPNETFLEKLDDVSRFALAAIMWNENVTAAEAARCLDLPVASVESALRRFHEHGVVRCVDERYRIETAWWSLVVRFLRRKHLVAS